MTARTLTCRELIEYLARYLDDELPAGERADFDAHLAICPACVDYLTSYRETIRIGKLACQPDEPASNDVPRELVDAILAARRRVV